MRLGFSLSLNYPLNKMRNYREPIPAPFSYRHISMEAPDNYSPDAPSQKSIDASLDKIMKERGIVSNEENKFSTIKKDKSSSKSPQHMVSGENPTISWPLAFAILFLVSSLFVYLFKKYCSNRNRTPR